MNPSQNCINLIKQFEGYRSKAYIDAVGIPTIGYGSTMWNDGKKVKLGETKLKCFGAQKSVVEDEIFVYKRKFW